MHRGGRNNHNNAPRAPVANELQTLVVRGWQQSKAASNADGGVESLLTFLEKKASPRNGPLYKAWDPEVVGDTLEIGVKEGSVDSYLHLNGFTWAGTTLSVELKRTSHRNALGSATNRSSSANNPLESRISAPTGPRQHHQSRSLPHATNSTQRHTRGQMSIDGQPGNSNSGEPHDLVTKAPVFRDQGGVAQNFIAAFFPLYDTNREEAIRNFYDDKSVFSLSVGSKHRKHGDQSNTKLGEYVRLSRNLKKLNNPAARATKKSTGQKDIFDIWNILPKTQHPPLADSTSWLFECHPIHNLPHPTDSTAVSGLSISIHGCFQDIDKNNQVDTKAFDRSFILGPGAGLGGIRVISDALVLRNFYPNNDILQKANLAPSGATPTPIPAAAQPQVSPQLAVPAPAPTPIPPHPEILPGSDFGQPMPGKSEEQLTKEKLKLQLSFATKMKLAFAEDALNSVNWDYPVALGKFNEMNSQGQIPAEVFLNV